MRTDVLTGRGRRLRRALFRALHLPAVVLVLAGCSMFGTDRPEPPPYPAVTDAGAATVVWHQRGLARAAAGFAPAVTGDGVWVAAVDGTIRRLDRDSGRVALQVRLDQRLGAGIAADESIVVVASRNGDVIALDAGGRTRWTRPLRSEIVTPPVVAGSVVVVRTQDGRIVAIDRDGGTIRWTWERPNPPLTLRQSAPMIVRDDMVYAGLPGARLVAIDQRIGAARWESVIATPRGTTELERLVDVVGRPAVSYSEVCAVAYQGKLACVRPESGQLIWSRDIASAAGLDLAGGTVVTVDASDIVQALGARGESSWRVDGYVRRGLQAPVIEDRQILLADRFGAISSLSLDDGRTLARVQVGSTPLASAPVVVGDIAFAQSEGGDVIAIRLR